MKRTIIAGMLALIATVATAQTIEQKRKLYALGNAGPAYCPDIETGWFKMASIGYDMTDAEYPVYKAEERKWFELFRSIGNRRAVCDGLMDKFGPGTATELFQYK